ncbi:hypothetical protein LHP98_14585 [Rhodobacter sp. Har01]|uniref:hypothetical protein n=1 Tax=Rhodobacter sp. Har01 TaxID=2883999 RepID=UPI001D066D62|nr:hypothetical protein [Rhodobacter sp. Har01]MCB6179348.1 hypothetical protein [Rhodobacter sp. Har01]
MFDTRRIVRLSGWLHRATGALILGLPVLLAVWLVRGWRDPAGVVLAFPEVTLAVPPTPGAALLTGAIGAVALGPVLLALAQMRALFALYRRAEILTSAAAGHILRSGRWLLVLAAVQVAVRPLQTIALTLGNPPGQRQVAVSLTGEMLWLALAGGLLVVIGWAMQEAARAAEENRGFV